MKILGIIPARAGSKGITDKNTKLCAGRALYEWSVFEGLKSNLDGIVISTDDDKILHSGLPFVMSKEQEAKFIMVERPKELCQDNTPMIDVMIHAAAIMNEFDVFMILQPTSPLRTYKHINKAIDIFEKNFSNYSSLMSVSKIPVRYNPEWLFFINSDGSLKISTGRNPKDRIKRRQDLPDAYETNGAIYIFKRENLNQIPPNLYGDKVLPYIISDEMVSIDTLDDLKQAERLLKMNGH